MTPNFKIKADNEDVTNMIKEHFISASIVDSVGFESDTLTIELDDSDLDLAPPRKGVELAVELGYKGNLRQMGVFAVDTSNFSGFPGKLTISAKAANYSASATNPGLGNKLKAYESRSWDSATLGSIITEIAGEAGYEASITSSMAAKTIEHIDQVNESNASFLVRLVERFGGFFKPSNRTVYVFESEQSAEHINYKGAINSYDCPSSERNNYSGVRTYWYDQDAAEKKPVTSGEEPYKDIPEPQSNEAEAREVVDAELKKLNREAILPTITMVGNNQCLAGATIALSGISAPKPAMEGTWKITQATHRFDDNGYTTELKLEVPHADDE